MGGVDGAGAVEDRPGHSAGEPIRADCGPRPPPLIPEGPGNTADEPFADCPELACLRGLLPDATLARAARRAAQAGVGADRVLIADGDLDEQTYTEALARWLGVPFEPLHNRRRSECPFPDERLIEAAAAGLLPLSQADGVSIVVVPAIAGSRPLATAVQPGSALHRGIRLTTTDRLQRFVTSRAAARIGRYAAAELLTLQPGLSAATAGTISWRAACLGIALAFAFVLAPDATWRAIEIALLTVFACWTGLRAISVPSAPCISQPARNRPDRDLPVYTVIVALHREASAVAGLVAALKRLRYPREKLDIKLVLEPDDEATIAAARALRLRAPFEIVIAPEAGPRTKPKALNAALLLARGAFVAVYDAEDRPDPEQLRIALEAFTRGGDNLACVQARLTVDNTADSWISALFTAEYAGLFDVLLPGLSRRQWPLPLGGSSNHFRTAVLRSAGAWDAYNVTEDADLGMRLSRFGYTTAVISSTTYEEAPARLRPWLHQRTRWFKGWMQTWLVHMRSPLRLWRELGPAGFVVFQLLVGGTVLGALVHVVFLALLAAQIATGSGLGTPELHLAALAIGYLASGALGFVGLMRRNLLAFSWALLLIPFYWLLLSAAAWRALHQLVRDPYRWEKTEHGLAATSRLAAQDAAGEIAPAGIAAAAAPAP